MRANHSKYEHARMKAPVFDLGDDLRKASEVDVDGAGLNHVGRDRVLIAKRAEAVDVRLSAATEQKLAWTSLLELRCASGNRNVGPF